MTHVLCMNKRIPKTEYLPVAHNKRKSIGKFSFHAHFFRGKVIAPVPYLKSDDYKVQAIPVFTNL
jgi:hypothetical protein